MCRNYKCAPLPFMGQKRYFLRDFTEVLQQVEGEIDTVVDLFGGSGLLSHTAKRVLPGCRVVYNDFDRYIDRLAAVATIFLNNIKSHFLIHLHCIITFLNG